MSNFYQLPTCRGLFDLSKTSKIAKKNTEELTRVFKYNFVLTECKFWVVIFEPKVRMGSVRLSVFLGV